MRHQRSSSQQYVKMKLNMKRTTTNTNVAEKAISMFKDHFQIILVGVDNTFTRHLWDQLLPQAESTLNMMQPTNIAPTISAHAYIYGQHDFNKMSLSPMGCVVVLLHNKHDIQKTWTNHAIIGYYVKTSRSTTDAIKYE